MDKLTDFYQNNKKILFGIITIGATGALGVYLYKRFKTPPITTKKPQPTPTPVYTQPTIKPSTPKPIQLTKRELLLIISNVRKLCNESLKTLRNNYRTERRKLFYDEEEYQQLLEEYDSKLLQVLESASEQVFKEYRITNTIFDNSVKIFNDDEEINTAVNSMATVEEECEAPEHTTKELLLEIFNYNNKRCNASVAESNKNFEYLNTRVQDEIYFKYKIEVEELSACYKKFNCENDPDFLAKIDEMQKSMSAYYNSQVF